MSMYSVSMPDKLAHRFEQLRRSLEFKKIPSASGLLCELIAESLDRRESEAAKRASQESAA